MTKINLGNNLNQIVNYARSVLFVQGELTQLSYNAFEHTATTIQDGNKEEIEISYPVGYLPSRTPILSKSKYKKKELIEKLLLKPLKEK